MVTRVELLLSEEEVTVHVEQEKGARQCCPTCREDSPGYDSRTRRWRHLDTCQYKTILAAEVPRVKCKAHCEEEKKYLDEYIEILKEELAATEEYRKELEGSDQRSRMLPRHHRSQQRVNQPT